MRKTLLLLTSSLACNLVCFLKLLEIFLFLFCFFVFYIS